MIITITVFKNLKAIIIVMAKILIVIAVIDGSLVVKTVVAVGTVMTIVNVIIV